MNHHRTSVRHRLALRAASCSVGFAGLWALVSACSGSDVSALDGIEPPPTIEAESAAEEAPEAVLDETLELTNKSTESPGSPIVDAQCFGGNIIPQDHIYFVGGPCDSRYQRNTLAVTKNAGFGSCAGTWVDPNPNSITDCRARVVATTAGGWGSVCCDTIITQTPAPNAKSCRARCGGASADGSCFCDSICHDNNDCCSDVDNACRHP